MIMIKKNLIRQIVLASCASTFLQGAHANLGQQMPPPGPNQVPDYFGFVPNYATSPQPRLADVTVTDAGIPAGPGVTAVPGGTGAVLAATTYDYVNGLQTDGIADIKVVNGGTGYTQNTLITINGAPNVTPITVTAIINQGVITGIAELDPSNALYIGAGKVLGSGFAIPIPKTGLRKFVDSLPSVNTANNLGQQLPLAVPDTTTFPGSDYYEIAETEYNAQLHSDLPLTHLRGYKQLNAPTGNAAGTNQYLGPIIIAQKGRPVRIKLVNQLPKSTDTSGLKGDLPFPVDTTYMGANDTQNRTAVHLHGGNTPWISDGTVHQWVKPAGEKGVNKDVSNRDVPDMYFVNGVVVPQCSATVTANCSLPANQAQVKLPVGASNSPGDGSQTYFYTNDQSARLMFYHDHAEGVTRLNVYAGLAAGYVLQDQTEQAMINGGTVNGVSFNVGTLPPLTDTIPLVLQEKTFVPDDTKPVINFYGAFKSQLNSQDPTWRWNSGNPYSNPSDPGALSLNGNGDLWVPHVYMPNQNPGDISGANAMGRWDYGPWFWPPFVGITQAPIANPYFDPNCISSLTNYCEGPTIPGAPNASNGSSPSGTPESFNDTPLINGTAYPSLTVEPKKYRLRMLSVANDRVLNLSLVVAASKNSKTTASANAGTNPSAVLCDGKTAIPATDCTEVKMLPFNSAQNAITPFPSHWYTPQNGGITFDDRPSGVFDPATRGPAMVQIGTEGGFLPAPVVIPNQPVNFEYNVKNIVVNNVKEHALLLGPAERADVVVDFSQYAGATLILYNDSPAPVPASDLRIDYYTGNFDNTNTGGAFSTLPGYGPNSRTLMQIKVASACSSQTCGNATYNNRIPSVFGPSKVDDVDNSYLSKLTPAIKTAFQTSQEPVIVPQVAYNGVYGTKVNDALGADLSRISDTQLTYNPLLVNADGSVSSTLQSSAVTLKLQPKSIIENFTYDYGRMNAQLGVEVPKTTAINATSIPQAYIDPPTELVTITPKADTPIGVTSAGVMTDGTQLWKITHNGVDTHAIHFHLFHVQVLNRVGWDGAVRFVDANELGWKDTVRMNPLEDIVVALRPKTMTNLPFKVTNSHRAMAPAATGNLMFENLDPTTGNVGNVSNQNINFGWEYLWHCHILGHEENDMMRTISVAVVPEAPAAVSAVTTKASATGDTVTLTWNDNSVTSNWFTIQRDTVATFNSANLKEFYWAGAECTQQAGCANSFSDISATTATTLYYRVKAFNTVGGGDVSGKIPAAGKTNNGPLANLTPNFTGYDNATTSSDWSNTVVRNVNPIASIAPSMDFGYQKVTSPATVVTKAVTLSNTGNGPLTLTNIALAAGSNVAFKIATTGTGLCNIGATNTLAAGSSCSVYVTYAPTTATAVTGTLQITDNSNSTAGSVQSVSLMGMGYTAPTLSATTLAFGSLSTVDSKTLTVTLTNPAGNATINLGAITVSGAGVSQTNNCPASLAAAASCTLNVKYQPTTVGTLTAASLSIAESIGTQALTAQTISLTGSAVAPISATAVTFATSITRGTSSSVVNSTVTNNTAGNLTLAATPAAVTGANATMFAIQATGTCTANKVLATKTSCTVGMKFSPPLSTTIGPKTATLTVRASNPASTATATLSGTAK